MLNSQRSRQNIVANEFSSAFMSARPLLVNVLQAGMFASYSVQHMDDDVYFSVNPKEIPDPRRTCLT